MHIRIIAVMCMYWFTGVLYAQHTDSLWVELEEVVINDSYRKSGSLRSPLSVEAVGKEFLTEHFTGNLVQTLQHIPGVHSMNIGSGFSKPMIRGMGFNRITVTENGIKQEGQQWGADHGLETDAFNAERVTVIKGPSSLLYGSDAMGGIIELGNSPTPMQDQLFGEVALLGKSVNGNLGGSLLIGFKKGNWFVKGRFSEQHFGDYRVPTDTVVYLTQRLPINGKRLKNTAGLERNGSFFTEYRQNRYFSTYSVSNVYQKTGFFPGAHGIPDASRLEDDGNRRNIELPYSKVNHFKVSTRQQYSIDPLIFTWDGGYQQNHREEWSAFHTHYGNQLPPEKDPDKELEFSLDTYSSSLKMRWLELSTWEHTAGWDLQYQHNNIGGYSFLLPAYDRFTTGVFWLTTYRPFKRFTISGGLRYDYGKIDISGYEDVNLESYLIQNGYSAQEIEEYRWRSYSVNRSFGDISGSLGIMWQLNEQQLIKLNAGRSFRLPGANELASNGVHHGTFRHERGNSSLSSERGWQVDLSYEYQQKWFSLSLSPFASWYTNYIYIRPSGQWSILPHAGQVYDYRGAKVTFTGAEVAMDIHLPVGFTYRFSGEYVYTRNRDEHIPLAFSPPASMRNRIIRKYSSLELFSELESIAKQNRVARNEDRTSGANLLHGGASYRFKWGGIVPEVSLSAHNLLNRRYYNHLSFYRKVEIPEPGRNFQLLIKIPFKN